MSKELSIINACLRATGESPVSSADSTHPSIAVIKSIISEVKLLVQSNKGRGLWFNTDLCISLPVTTEGVIVIPESSISVDCHNKNLVTRSGLLYDRSTHSYQFTSAVQADVQYDLGIEDLPQLVIELIRTRSRAKYLHDDDGDTQKLQSESPAIQEATVAVQTEDRRQKNLNRITNPKFQQMRSKTTGSFGSHTPSGDYIGGRPL